MKKLRVILSLSAMLLLAIACSEDKTVEAERVLSIDISSAKPLSENILGISARKLNDSTSTNFPGSISKVRFAGNSLYILDGFKDKGIYKYSDGVLAASYCKRGQGPDEFLSLSDFVLSPDGIIAIDSYNVNGKLIYLGRDFNYQTTKQLDYRPDHIWLDSKGGMWADLGNNTYGGLTDKLVYVKDGKKKAVLPIPDKIADVTFAPPYVFASYAADTVLYLPPVETTIYKCVYGEAKPWLELDFNGRWPDYDNKERHEHPVNLVNRIKENGQVNFVNIFTDGDDLLVYFIAGETNYLYFTDFADNYSKLYSYTDEQAEKLGDPSAYKDGEVVFVRPGGIVAVTPNLQP